MRQKVITFFASLVISTWIFLPTQSVFALPKQIEFSETITSLGRIPEGSEMIPKSFKYSPDLKHITYVAYQGINKESIVRLDNKTSPVYYSVQANTPKFSTSNRHAYIAYPKKGGDAVIVVDWKQDKVFGNISDFMFSPDGNRYAYRAANNNQQCVVVDGKNEPWYTGIVVKENFTFSPDSRHLAYVAYRDNACVLVLDGKEQEHEFELIQDVEFSPDSQKIAYKGRIKKDKDGQESWCVVLNGKKQATYERIFVMKFTNDSNRFAYPAVKNKKMVLVVDGEEKPPQDQYGLPVFSPDSKTLAYSFKKNNDYHIVVGTKQGPGFPSMYSFYFSPHSTHYAYIAGKESRLQCIVDGVAGPEFKQIASFKFSDDSTRYAYMAHTENGGAIVIDGKVGDTHISVGEPYFSPDSKHTIYKTRREKDAKWESRLDSQIFGDAYQDISQYYFSDDSKHLGVQAYVSLTKSVMVIDGVNQCSDENFNAMDRPYFSPDSRHVAYVAGYIEKLNYFVVVNGHVLPTQYSGFIEGTPLVFDDSNRFHTIAAQNQGSEFVLVEVEIPANIGLKTELPNQ